MKLFNHYKVANSIMHSMEEFTSEQRLQLKELAIPFALLDYQGKMFWGRRR